MATPLILFIKHLYTGQQGNACVCVCVIPDAMHTRASLEEHALALLHRHVPPGLEGRLR
jgi:hypothetical protein